VHPTVPLEANGILVIASAMRAATLFRERTVVVLSHRTSSKLKNSLHDIWPRTNLEPPNAQRTEDLLVSINYVRRSAGVLSGYHNDVKMRKQFIISQGR